MPPFDPDQPANNSALSSQVMRGQLNGLNDLITAINAVNAATVDGVTTLNPGDPAQVLLNLIANTLHFTFAIPRGQEGQAGQDGATGPQGPAFANAVVDAVNTLPAGSAATVSVSFDGNNVHFTFGIPEGSQGAQGAVGPPGEVTSSDLNNAISGTSGNSNAVPTMDVPFTNDPPTLVDMETMRAAYNTLVVALRRQ
jgi:hypothetical protein